jgi:spore maturation protein CgeB
MERHMKAVLNDPNLRSALIENGLKAIRSRHSCAHRADQLLAILANHGASTPMEIPA